MTVSTEVTGNESDTYRQEGHMKTGQDTLEPPAAGRGRGGILPQGLQRECGFADAFILD